MSDGKKFSVLGAILIAAVVCLVVNLVRLYGEVQGWAPSIFSREPGGGMSPLGITWLSLLFAFVIGRKLAQNGGRPKAMWKAFVFPLIGFAIVIGTFMLMFPAPDSEVVLTADEWRNNVTITNSVAAASGLLLLFAWPRGWLALALFGFLIRVPVAVIQMYALENNWGTHFEFGPPGMPEAVVPFALTMAQSLFWPLGFTVLAGGLFAAFGAATVRK